MVTKEQIEKIIRDETWVEVDSAIVYGVNDAAEKIIQAIEAAQHRVQPTGGTPCCECGMIGGHLWECKLG
jgi:hypothetical protein